MPRSTQTELPPGPTRAATDLAWLVAVTVVLCALALRYRPLEAVQATLGIDPRWQLDGVIALLLLLPAATVVLAVRRWREVEQARGELARLAQRDPLTGLPNRALLTDRLEHSLGRARRSRRQVAVLFCALDRFKMVNDSYGHSVGDDILRAAADRLRSAVRPGDTIGRLGGDQFVAVCDELSTSSDAKAIAERITATFEAPFEIDGGVLHLTASLGTAVADGLADAETMLRDAEFAMYQAKAGAPGAAVTYDTNMRAGAGAATTEKAMRRALDEQQFRLLYQPIVSVTDEHIVAVEAVLRWDDPERGLVEHAEFGAVLDETGLVVPVGAWVLEEATRQARRWHEGLGPERLVQVAVNVSGRQLVDREFRGHLSRALEASGADPRMLCLEITEAALMGDMTWAWSVLRDVKALGIHLAIDNFGTGYSSLSYVRRFALDALKIDRSFVDGLAVNVEDRAIVAAIIGMAKGLQLVAVADGVETAEQLAVLRSLGCHRAQGRLISRPQPADVIDALLAAPLFAQAPDVASPALAAPELASALNALWDAEPKPTPSRRNGSAGRDGSAGREGQASVEGAGPTEDASGVGAGVVIGEEGG